MKVSKRSSWWSPWSKDSLELAHRHSLEWFQIKYNCMFAMKVISSSIGMVLILFVVFYHVSSTVKWQHLSITTLFQIYNQATGSGRSSSLSTWSFIVSLTSTSLIQQVVKSSNVTTWRSLSTTTKLSYSKTFYASFHSHSSQWKINRTYFIWSKCIELIKH